MRQALLLVLLSGVAFAQTVPAGPSKADAVRVREFYRLSNQIAEQVWPGWESTPAPLLLVTADKEFLTHRANPPADFTKVDGDFYVRPRKFPTGLLATFPAFGPPSVIVIGEPEATTAKTSTPWLITVMHEHFHQLQDGQPGISDAVNRLGLARGDQTGMWMLNYAFPYDKPEVVAAFVKARDLLLTALVEKDGSRFQMAVANYKKARANFFAQVSPDDRRYFSFQLWKEGIARYVEVKSAEAAEQYKPSAEFAALPDYEPPDKFGAKARAATVDELRHADISSMKRVVVYSFGACEGFLLDRIKPNWRDTYFRNVFTLDPYFD